MWPTANQGWFKGVIGKHPWGELESGCVYGVKVTFCTSVYIEDNGKSLSVNTPFFPLTNKAVKTSEILR